MPGLVETRRALQRVAVHVLARRRHAVTGRFGLRATPGGFGTPAFGPPDAIEVLRVAGTTLVHEVGGDTDAMTLQGASLRQLASLADVDLDGGFSAGADTPPVGDPDEPLALDPGHAAAIADWFDLGWRAMDRVLDGTSRAGTIQLWPEHFDAGCSTAVGADAGDRANLGTSPGDGFSDEPYLYVGPWTDARPGDPAFWNAPFGAARLRGEVATVDDAVAFYREGLAQLTLER